MVISWIFRNGTHSLKSPSRDGSENLLQLSARRLKYSITKGIQFFSFLYIQIRQEIAPERLLEGVGHPSLQFFKRHLHICWPLATREWIHSCSLHDKPGASQVRLFAVPHRDLLPW